MRCLEESTINTRHRRKKRVLDKITKGLKEAIEDFGSGKKLTFDKSPLPEPPKRLKPKDVIRIRKQLNMSQRVFAIYLNVSVKAVQAWEQGISSPTGGMIRFLRIIDKSPDILKKL